MNPKSLPFEQFTQQQTSNLWRGAWVTVLCVVVLNLLIGQAGHWVWVGAFALFTLGLQVTSRWNVYVSALLHFISTLIVIAWTVNDPSGPARNVDPSLVFSTISIPTIMSVSVFFGWAGAIIAAITGVILLVLMRTTDYLPFTTFQIVSVAFFGSMIYNIIKQLEQAKTALERAAMLDTLTDLENRRSLETNYERYTSMAHRQGVQLVMTSWDLNDLKRINDAHGHAAGDKHLRAFTDALRLEARAEDAFFRVGGDEFIGLHLNLTDATELIDRVRDTFPSVAAGWTKNTHDLDAAMAEADRMMYAHKSQLKSDSERTEKETTYVVA